MQWFSAVCAPCCCHSRVDDAVLQTKSDDSSGDDKKRSKWDADIALLEDGVRLLFSNGFAEAEAVFLRGFRQGVDVSLRPEEHDLRAEFAFNWALASMIRGIVTLEANQFNECLLRVQQAAEVATSCEDAAWIGHQIILGCCHALQGVIRILQRSFIKGVVALAHSWMFLRSAEALCSRDPQETHEEDQIVTRSASLFICGVVGLIGSLLPPSIGGPARRFLGLPVDRNLAAHWLVLCWSEKGLLAPWACAVALAYYVDIRFFLGDDIALEEIERCRTMLQWALARHPGSIVFGLLEANLAGLEYQNDKAVALIKICAAKIPEAPALGLIIHAQHAKFALLGCRWLEAAHAFAEAAGVNKNVGRRSLVPTFMFASALCSMRAGNMEAAQRSLRAVCDCKTLVKRNWDPSDKQSFWKAEEYLDDSARFKTAPLLDILDLLELKLHALRRMSANSLRTFLRELDQHAEVPLTRANEARRLRYGGELARLLGHTHVEVRGRLKAAQAVIEQCYRERRESTRIDGDGTSALIEYSIAEIYYAENNSTAVRERCHRMQRYAWRADYAVILVFKAHNLEQRVRQELGPRSVPILNRVQKKYCQYFYCNWAVVLLATAIIIAVSCGFWLDQAQEHISRMPE